MTQGNQNWDLTARLEHLIKDAPKEEVAIPTIDHEQ